MLPALAGEHDFEHCINAKSYQKELLRPSNRTDYNHSGAVYGTWNLQNRLGKCVFSPYVPSLEASFAIMCSIACILDDIFTFSQCFRHHFAEKWTLFSEVASHKYVRLTVPARYDVYMSPWYLLLGVADFELHAFFRPPAAVCRA